MTLTDKQLDEFIAISEKEGIKYKTRAEAQDSAQNLVQLCDIVLKMGIEEDTRQKRLKKEPKGFAISGEGRTCLVCRNHISEDMWYDKWGQKCMACQEAVNKKIVPGYICKDDKNEKHITASNLSYKTRVKAQIIKKLVREDKLKPRIVKGNGTMVFLRKENPDILEIIEQESVKKAG